jgi:succinate dehydrogenase hydrophobic anchor subunit
MAAAAAAAVEQWWKKNNFIYFFIKKLISMKIHGGNGINLYVSLYLSAQRPRGM